MLVAAVFLALAAVPPVGDVAAAADGSRTQVDCTEATDANLRRQLRENDTVTLLPCVYRIKRSPQAGMVASIRIPWGTTVIGNGAIIRPAETETNLIEMGPRSTLSGLTVDTQNGMIDQGAVTIFPGGTDITISDVIIRGAGKDQRMGIKARPPAPSAGEPTPVGSRNLQIKDVRIFTVRQAIYLYGNHIDTLVSNTTISTWCDRGIYVQGSEELGASRNLVVRGVRVNPNIPDAACTSRYPIVTGSTGPRHRNVTIEDTDVVGPGCGYHDSQCPGTADQISVRQASGVTIRGNRSIKGGELGINVSNATDVVIEDNYVEAADAPGVNLGHGGSAEPVSVRRYLVRGNTLVANGQNRDGTTRPWAKTGIALNNARDGDIVDNHIVADPVNTRYGIVVRRNSSFRRSGNTFVNDFIAQLLVCAPQACASVV